MMSLITLKEHLLQVRISTLSGIADYFRCDAELLRDMLTHWVRKGRVRCFTKTPGCKDKCGQCKSVDYELYEWVH